LLFELNAGDADLVGRAHRKTVDRAGVSNELVFHSGTVELYLKIRYIIGADLRVFGCVIDQELLRLPVSRGAQGAVEGQHRVNE
jgi:hypothetical protein